MANKEVQRISKRITFFVVVLSVSIVILLLRLIVLQVFDSSDLIMKNDSQVEVNRELQSPRGTIYDRNGNPLAMSVMTKSLYADPAMIDMDHTELAEKLEPYLTIKKDKIKELLDTPDTAFVWLDRMMDPDKSKAVEALIEEDKILGLNFVEESRRFYPNNELAAQVLGFVGTENKGLDGLEMVLDDDIKGSIDKQLVATDRHGNAIFGSVMSKFLPDKSKSVTLTIDSTVQFIAERALDKAMAETKPDHASVIIMDPKTGEILAMANRPTYDPNHYEKSKADAFKNIAVTNLYEPGSTFKPIIASAALASGKWSTDTVYHDTGHIQTNNHVMQNWNGEGYGDVRLLEILKFSINTGMAKIGLTTGPEILVDYVKKFGFGSPTGIELPGEGEGILFEAKNMEDVDTASMSIGQSIAVTPLQMVRAFGALANDGKMMKPHIIKSFNNPDGSLISETKSEEVGQPIPSEIDKKIVDILEKEVSEGGGNKAMIAGYHFAGKTGTAQKLNTESGGYLDGQYIASFIGFGPIEDPRFVALVVIDNPSMGSIYGGQIAAPVFKDIMSQLVRYYQISPSVKEKVKNVNTVEKQTLAQPSLDASGNAILPDFTGYTLGEVRNWIHDAGLSFRPIGTGTAVNQVEPVGYTAHPGEAITVYFNR